MVKPTLITQAAYARSRKERGLSGGTPKAVLDAIRAGRISAIKDADGRELIDPAVADIQWAENTRPRADYHGIAGIVQEGALLPSESTAQDHQPAADARGSDFWEAATREKQASARLKEFEVEQQAGSLVDRAGVERAAYTAARQLRDMLINAFPGKVAARLAPITDAWELEQSLRVFIADELAALATAPMQDAAA